MLSTLGGFLVSSLFGLIILALWLRIALRYFKVSFLNPFNKLAYSITEPVLGPLNRLLKYQEKPKNKYEWTALLVLVLTEVLKIISLSLIIFNAIVPFGYLILFVLADLIIQICNILFYAILIRVIMSYVNPTWSHPLGDLLRVLTEPLLIFGRKVIPDISGFDFSPMFIMMLLKVITLFMSTLLPAGF